jgi:hypothetical protein
MFREEKAARDPRWRETRFAFSILEKQFLDELSFTKYAGWALRAVHRIKKRFAMPSKRHVDKSASQSFDIIQPLNRISFVQPHGDRLVSQQQDGIFRRRDLRRVDDLAGSRRSIA